MRRLRLLIVVLGLSACASQSLSELEPVTSVDLERFMGDWYVVAAIPTFIERNSTENLEQYQLRPDGDVDITFSLTTAEGERKSYSARGFVQDAQQPSRWKVQFFWPIKFPFYVIDLAPDYSYTVIGLPNRKYVWIMSRDQTMDPMLYDQIMGRLVDIGYDASKIKRVPTSG